MDAMLVWALIMWTPYIDPFGAGIYRDKVQCERAALQHKVGLRHLYGSGKLMWRCTRRHGNLEDLK